MPTLDLRFLSPCLFVFMLTLITACTTPPAATDQTPDEPLTNTFWALESLRGSAVDVSELRSRPHLLFTDDGQVHGDTGCNRLRGEYGGNEQEFRFLSLGSTRMACPQSSVEAQFLSVLQDTAWLGIAGRQLVLKDEQGAELARFRAIRGER